MEVVPQTRFLVFVVGIFGLALSIVARSAEGNPVLKENDVIKMEIFEEPDLTTNTKILRSGEIVLPLVGTVQLAGLTVSEANDKIRDLYISEEYLAAPKVTLTVQEYSQDYISVIGAVRSPGQFAIPSDGKFDLAAALASAGGLGPEANPNGITLTRANGGKSTHSEAALRGGTVILLSPGDRITVDQSAYVNKTATVLGQVDKTGPVPFPINGRLDIVSAIAAAGGFTELANPKKVSVNRKGRVTILNVKEMTDKGDKPYYLQPDDIVTVAERFF